MCDANMGVMMWAEIQEGKEAMREKERNMELVTTCATVLRGMESGTLQPGTTLLGESWFVSVKVSANMG
jgi:hypothetical protein